MRRSGLTHLLSVSGLHIAAVVAFAMFLTLKLLALSERLALRFNLVLVAAAAAAAAGIGYTLLTGAQVPTVRSCVAAVLILAGIALGRDAISIRLIAAGALVVLLFRPEALAGPSFQMSFAAVTAIVALHSTAWSRRLFQRREEGIAARVARALLAMIATGLVVELALMPMALFHFHRAGLYGVGANIVAIPLTTFVIMPVEAGALLLDLIGWGKPLMVPVRGGHRRAARTGPRGGLGQGGRRLHAVDAGLVVRPDGRRRAMAVPVERAAAIAGIWRRLRSALSARCCRRRRIC